MAGMVGGIGMLPEYLRRTGEPRDMLSDLTAQVARLEGAIGETTRR